MPDIEQLRHREQKVISLGSHPGIIQSMLDYDYLIGHDKPSIIAIITGGHKQERYFWGEGELTVPVYGSLDSLPDSIKLSITAVINVSSARRVLSSMKEAIDVLPLLQIAVIFAEQTPESHALEIDKLVAKKDILIIGPSSVGLLIAGHLKIGAIGGTQHEQLTSANIIEAGGVAVLSTSGGVVNELIRMVTGTGLGISFALAVGGDTHPLTTPAQAVMLAQKDKMTKTIVYFGELGGKDEYEIAELIHQKKITKDVIVHVAGVVAELFEEPPQFGHAKAFAETVDESAAAKKVVLRKSGAIVCETFADIRTELLSRVDVPLKRTDQTIGGRRHAMIVSHISGENEGNMQLLGEDLLSVVAAHSIASLTLSLLLGKQVTSKRAVECMDFILRVLMDHGPSVSGAVNTVIAARAGKDLVSSLASGLLTVGPRFGGALNAAAGEWLKGVSDAETPRAFVESFVQRGGVIPGIGHKKYRGDAPDPRIEALKKFTGNSNGDRYFTFASRVADITIAKKNNLILNVDGAIAAIMLDILESELGYTHQQLQELVTIEFFNALFVVSRSVGFTAHYIDQRRHDEGLFRLPDSEVSYIIGSTNE